MECSVVAIIKAAQTGRCFSAHYSPLYRQGPARKNQHRQSFPPGGDVRPTTALHLQQPVFLGFSPQIALDDKPASIFEGNSQVIRRVVAGVHTQQKMMQALVDQAQEHMLEGEQRLYGWGA